MEFLAESMLNITLSMSVIILLMLIFSRIAAKKLTARCRYLLWCLVILRLAIPAVGLRALPPLFTVTLPETVIVEEDIAETLPELNELPYSVMPQQPFEGSAQDIIAAPPSEDIPNIPNYTQNITPDTTQGMPGEIITPIIPETLPVTTPAPEESNITLDLTVVLRIVMHLWAVIALGSFAFRMLSYLHFVLRMKKGNAVCTDERIHEIYDSLCTKNSIRRRPRLCMNDGVTSPMVYGYFKPIIILPSDIRDEFALRGILFHELVHYRRGDLYMKLIAQLALSLHWFNPLVYIASDRLAQTAELACDERVLAACSMSDRVDYGNVMLDIIKQSSEERIISSSMSTHFNPRTDAVKERFRNILDMRQKNFALWLVVLLMIACIIAGTLVACSFRGDADGEQNSEGKDAVTTEADTESEETESAETVTNIPETGDDRLPPDVFPVTGIDSEVLLTGYYNLSEKASAQLSASSEHANKVLENVILIGLMVSEDDEVHAVYKTLGGDSNRYAAYTGGEQFYLKDAYPGINTIVPTQEMAVGWGINATLICDSQQILMDEAGDGNFFFEQGWLFQKRHYQGTIHTFRLPISEAYVPDLEIQRSERVFTHNWQEAMMTLIPGGDIGGDENCLYVFITYDMAQTWYVTALPAPGVCVRGSANYDEYGNLHVYAIGEGNSDYNRYFSYNGGFRFVMVDDMYLGEGTAVEVKTPNEHYSASVNGFAYATLYDMMKQGYPFPAHGDASEEYILVGPGPAGGESVILKPGDALYDDVSALLYRRSMRIYISDEWQYPIAVASGNSPTMGQFALRWNPGNASGAGWNTYDIMSGDGAGYKKITFCEQGAIITFDTNHRSVEGGTATSLYRILCDLSERGEGVHSDELEVYRDELRARVMLLVDGVELPIRLTFAAEDKSAILVQTDTPIKYDSILSYMQIIIGDTYSRFDTIDELIAAQNEETWQEFYEYALMVPYVWHIDYLTAIKSGDTARLEQMSGGLTAGMYDSYKSLKFAEGDYFEIIHLGDLNKPFYWHVTITESEVPGLPAGDYVFRLDEGIRGVTLNRENAQSVEIHNYGVRSDLLTWLGTCGMYEIPDWGDWNAAVAEGRLSENIYAVAFDYLSCRYGPMTAEQINDYGYRAFGIDELFSHLGLDKNSYEYANGKYGVAGHGGEIWSYDIVDCNFVGESASVTVQFWADWSKTIPSHRITYRFGIDVPEDGGLPVNSIVGITYESRGAYEPAHTAV